MYVVERVGSISDGGGSFMMQVRKEQCASLFGTSVNSLFLPTLPNPRNLLSTTPHYLRFALILPGCWRIFKVPHRSVCSR